VAELDFSPGGPEALARENARRKALAAAEIHPAAIVLGADTVVTIDGETLGKPASLEEAHRMLEKLGGRWHEVLTAVFFHWPFMASEPPAAETENSFAFVGSSRVLLRQLSPAERCEYFRRINPLDKAGAYAAQEKEFPVVEAVNGSISNVIGLPMELLAIHGQKLFPQLWPAAADDTLKLSIEKML
jgi:septum formation protein